MKAKSHSTITFSQAVNGYLLAAQSRHLSQHTIDEYLNTFRKFQASLDDDPPLITLSPGDVEAFLAAQTVSKKTILNYHIGLSALWTWAVNEGLVDEDIVHQVERAKPEKRSISPYSEEDIKAMLLPSATRGSIPSRARVRRLTACPTRSATGRSSWYCWIRGCARRSCAS